MLCPDSTHKRDLNQLGPFRTVPLSLLPMSSITVGRKCHSDQIIASQKREFVGIVDFRSRSKSEFQILQEDGVRNPFLLQTSKVRLSNQSLTLHQVLIVPRLKQCRKDERGFHLFFSRRGSFSSGNTISFGQESLIKADKKAL